MNPALAGRLVVGLAGPWPTPEEFVWLAKWKPAGVILFSRNIIDYKLLQDLCRVLHELVPELEIMADHEGGPVSHLAAAIGRPPSHWSLGVLDDVGLTARIFTETAQRLHAVGVDRVLAPVADVLTEMRNPVIGVRSFGSDPVLVTRHTVAAVTGLLSGGVKVCLKHWPGHGGSLTDTHLAESVVGQGAIPAPFTGGLNAGAGAVMVGHLLANADNRTDPGYPATLDRDFLRRSRAGLGPGSDPDLLLFADDVTMGGLGPAMRRLGVTVPEPEAGGMFDPASLPVAWFERLADAGCDRLLIRGLPTRAFPPGDRFSGVVARESAAPPSGPVFPSGAYEEARRRLWTERAAFFPDRQADLLWLDYSRGDRWEIAAGPPGTDLETVPKVLARMFRAVDSSPGPEDRERPWSRLLVTSHRPLPDPFDPDLALAKKGVCLALGHPSLETDLSRRLPSGWKLASLYDIAPEDLVYGLDPREH
jgi:hypothetical protein